MIALRQAPPTWSPWRPSCVSLTVWMKMTHSWPCSRMPDAGGSQVGVNRGRLWGFSEGGRERPRPELFIKGMFGEGWFAESNRSDSVSKLLYLGLLLDLLQRTGKKGFVAFLESLELYYPHLYKKITGNDPTRVFSMIIDTAGESGLTELLMSEVSKLQAAIREERQKVQELNVALSTKEDTIKEMRVRDSVLRKYQERAHKVKEERDALSKELILCREENYKMAMKYAKQSEEKNVALMKNRDLQLEIDCLRHSLVKAEDHCSLERKHTLNLKRAMEQRPSHEAVWEIQREKDLLLAKNKELESTLQVTKKGSSETGGVPHQALEAEWRRVLKEQQELVNTTCDLRQALQRAEDGRDKLVGEKELLELRCTSLQNDNQIFQNRTKAILKQLEEVAAERDQALLTQEECQKQYSQGLREKDSYRKEIRELGERCDELQLQLFQKKGRLLSAEAQLKRLCHNPSAMTSDLEENSSRSSQELTPHGNPDENGKSAKPRRGLADGDLPEKGHRRMKDSFEHYRRKRALRKVQESRYHEAYWEHSSGSDNTDTEGS
ncbi:caspase recruitment domain-containing protein 9 isoform 2-T2 [Vipera latastei]